MCTQVQRTEIIEACELPKIKKYLIFSQSCLSFVLPPASSPHHHVVINRLNAKFNF